MSVYVRPEPVPVFLIIILALLVGLPVFLFTVGTLIVIFPVMKRISGQFLAEFLTKFRWFPITFGFAAVSTLLTLLLAMNTTARLQADYTLGEGLKRACQSSRSGNLIAETGEAQVFEKNSYVNTYQIGIVSTIGVVLSIVTLNGLLMRILSISIGTLDYGALAIYVMTFIVGFIFMLAFIITHSAYKPPSSKDKPYFKEDPTIVNEGEKIPKFMSMLCVWYFLAGLGSWYASKQQLGDPRQTDLPTLFKYFGMSYFLLIILAAFKSRVLDSLSSLVQKIADYSNNAYVLTQALSAQLTRNDKLLAAPGEVAHMFNQYFINNYREATNTKQQTGILQDLTPEAFKYLNVTTKVNKLIKGAPPAVANEPLNIVLDDASYDAYQKLRGISMGDDIADAHRHTAQMVYAFVIVLLVIPFHKFYMSSPELLGKGLIGTVGAFVALMAAYSFVPILTNAN